MLYEVITIPGMPGVGPKTAVALLQGMGDIATIAAQPERIAALGFRGAKGFAAKFEEFKEQVLLSRTLATIKTDVPLEVGVGDLHRGLADRAALLSLYQEFEFRNLLQELEQDSTAPSASEA